MASIAALTLTGTHKHVHIHTHTHMYTMVVAVNYVALVWHSAFERALFLFFSTLDVPLKW